MNLARLWASKTAKTVLVAAVALGAVTALRAVDPVQIAQLREHLWPLIESGAVKPIVGRTVLMSNAADAHRRLEAGDVFGKVLIKRER